MATPVQKMLAVLLDPDSNIDVHEAWVTNRTGHIEPIIGKGSQTLTAEGACKVMSQYPVADEIGAYAPRTKVDLGVTYILSFFEGPTDSFWYWWANLKKGYAGSRPNSLLADFDSEVFMGAAPFTLAFKVQSNYLYVYDGRGVTQASYIGSLGSAIHAFSGMFAAKISPLGDTETHSLVQQFNQFLNPVNYLGVTLSDFYASKASLTYRGTFISGSGRSLQLQGKPMMSLDKTRGEVNGRSILALQSDVTEAVSGKVLVYTSLAESSDTANTSDFSLTVSSGGNSFKVLFSPDSLSVNITSQLSSTLVSQTDLPSKLLSEDREVRVLVLENGTVKVKIGLTVMLEVVLSGFSVTSQITSAWSIEGAAKTHQPVAKQPYIIGYSDDYYGYEPNLNSTFTATDGSHGSVTYDYYGYSGRFQGLPSTLLNKFPQTLRYGVGNSLDTPICYRPFNVPALNTLNIKDGAFSITMYCAFFTGNKDNETPVDFDLNVNGITVTLPNMPLFLIKPATGTGSIIGVLNKSNVFELYLGGSLVATCPELQLSRFMSFVIRRDASNLLEIFQGNEKVASIPNTTTSLGFDVAGASMELAFTPASNTPVANNWTSYAAIYDIAFLDEAITDNEVSRISELCGGKVTQSSGISGSYKDHISGKVALLRTDTGELLSLTDLDSGGAFNIPFSNSGDVTLAMFDSTDTIGAGAKETVQFGVPLPVSTVSIPDGSTGTHKVVGTTYFAGQYTSGTVIAYRQDTMQPLAKIVTPSGGGYTLKFDYTGDVVTVAWIQDKVEVLPNRTPVAI